MNSGRNHSRKARHSRPTSSNDRSNRGSSNSFRPQPQNSHNAQGNYERYLTLAQAEAQSGNAIGAENYYQYAEHYFRMMTSDKIPT
jgi:hypothetical protein